MNIKTLNVSLLSFSIITALFPLNAMATKLTIEQRLELLENELSQNKQELKATQNELGVYKSRLSTLQKSITENYSLNWFWDHFQLPLFIVENGFGAVDQRQADGTVNDHYRIDYFASHIREMKKRYGMIYVDKDNEGKGTLERIRKASFYWYRDLIANNGENI
ncbi:TPA: family 1 glycosylhydrolase [Escherichia coli]|nr:6-phospho-beta-glucosidase [Escherichia coli]HAH9623466.1 family 1 glycosylhydrolase [Escherichia coli]HAI2259913.1 family 1 glycosylhydrolase [Escherichia coli]